MTINQLEKISTQVRRDVIRMIKMAGSGHVGGSLGCADFMTSLYFEVMNHNPNFNMDGIGEDIFILSNGHICPVLYSVLARCQYFDLNLLNQLRKINSPLQGHPATKEKLPGIRIATGSLGQGLSVAIGIALSKKLLSDENHVFVLCGDGEIQEGQIWEAALFAQHHKVDNLTLIIDCNNAQIDGKVQDVIGLGDLYSKWESFNWEVLKANGNNMLDITNKLKQSKLTLNKPTVILMETKMGKGVNFMEDNYKWHGKVPNDDEFKSALSQLPETLGDF